MSRWSRVLALVAVPFLLIGVAPAARADAAVVVPLVDCVTHDAGAGTVTAEFGYVNPGAATVTIDYGPNNILLQAPNFRPGQPTVFLPGLQHDVWQVTFSDTSALSWVLDGTTATATDDPSHYCGAPTLDDASLTMPATLTTTAGADGQLTATVTDPKAASTGSYGTVVYRLPEGLDVGTLPSGSPCTTGTGQVVCPISAGSDHTLAVRSGTPGVYPVTATYLSSQFPDPDATNNVATTAVRVVGAPTAVTGLAGALTTTGAELTGTANPAGDATTGSLTYWPDGHPELATTVGPTDLGDGVDTVPLDAVVTGLSPATTYVYQATATNAQGTATGDQRSFTTPATMPPSAGLAVTASTAPASATVGSPITQTFTVADAGPSDATGVQLTIALPAGLGSVAAVPAAGTCTTAGTLVSCALGTVADGTSVDVTLTGLPSGAGTLLTSAFVSGAEPDPSVADNFATTAVPVSASGADLSIAVTGPSSAHGSTPFTVVLRNAGPDRANDVHLALSTVYGQVTAVNAPGQYCRTGSAPGCLIDHLPAGGVVRVTVMVAPRHRGPVTLSATVTSSTPDPDPSDNQSSATVRAR